MDGVIQITVGVSLIITGIPVLDGIILIMDGDTQVTDGIILIMGITTITIILIVRAEEVLLIQTI